MKALRIFFFTALLAAAGCEKSSNIQAMQDETAGLASHYRTRFEELIKRYQQLDKHKRTEIDSNKDMKALWSSTQRRLAELRTATQQAQTAIATAAKSPTQQADLIRLQADLRQRFERGETEVTANLHAVETWLSSRAYVAMHGSDTDISGDPTPDLPKTGVHPDGKVDEEVKQDEAKADAPKADAPTADAPTADAPKADAPKADAPKAEAPKANAPAPKADAPKAGSGAR